MHYALDRLAHAIKATQDAVIITDRQGNIEFVNPAFEKVTGYTQKEALNKTPAILKSGEQPDTFYRDMWDTITSGQTWQGQVTNRRRDGSLYEAQLTISPMRDQQDQVTHFVAIQRDVSEQKHLQQKLAQSEKTLRQMIDRSPLGIFRATPQGEILDANPACLEILGFEKLQEIQELGLEKLYANPADHERLLALLRLGPVSDFQTRLRQGGDTDIHTVVSIHATLVQDETGTAYIDATFQDITENREALEQLAIFRTLTENANDAIGISDLYGEHIYGNRAYYEIYGYAYDSHEMVGLKVTHLFPPNEKERLNQEILPQAIDSKWRGEVLNQRRDGDLFYAAMSIFPLRDEQRNPTHLAFILRDISERVKAEQELEAQWAFLRQVIEVNPNFVFVRDRQGRFILANSAVAEAYGATVDELVGKTDADFNPNQDQVEKTWRDDREVMDSLQDKRISEAGITDAQGNVRWIQTIKRPLIDPDGVARRVLGVSTDITERKRLEAEIQKSLERRSQEVQISTQIAQEIAAAPALDELFHRVVTLIKERFDYYHAQIFRYMPALDAVVLVVGYGQRGKDMLAAGHRLQMGRGVVGTAAATGQTVLASDVTQDPDWVPNPFLPHTKGELAVPIVLRRSAKPKSSGQAQHEILGILDVQEDTPGALTEDDQLLLEGLCGQIAIAMESTRLRQEMQERLQELDALYRATTSKAWQGLEGTAPDYIFDPSSGSLSQTKETPQELSAQTHSVPIVLRGNPIGQVIVHDDPHAPLSAQDKALVQNIIEGAAQALESARLFQQAQKQAFEQSVLSEMGRELTTQLDVREVTASVYQHTSRLLDTTNFYIALYDEENQEISFPIMVHQGTKTHEPTRSPSQGLTEYVIENREPLLVPENLHTWLQQHNITLQGPQAQCWLGVPMMSGEHVLGVIALQNYTTPNHFNPRDLELLQAIATQTAISIQNARLFEQIQITLNASETLSISSAELNQARNYDQVLRVLREYTLLSRAQNVTINLFEHDWTEEKTPTWANVVARWSELETPSSRDRYPLVANAWAMRLLRPDAPLIVQDVANDPRIDETSRQALLQRLGIHSTINIPLTAGQRWIGTLNALFKQPTTFHQDQVRRLMTLAGQAAIIVQTLRQLKAIQSRARREQMIREINTKITQSGDMEAVLQNTARELCQALGASHAVIRLKDQDV